MSRIFVPLRGAADWQSLLGNPQTHWREGFSAMAAARSWMAADGLPTEFRAILGEDAELILAIPEHKVPLPGRGAASQCDVFALVRSGARTIALAVEAKVEETFDKPIGEWRAGASDDKRMRLQAICALLGC